MRPGAGTENKENEDKMSRSHPTWMILTVWTLRIAIGGIFVVSGMSKAIDLWGFVYKIEEYLRVWSITEPRSIVVVVSLAIVTAEFLLGVMLFIGAYKRTSVWLLMGLMCFMLPLSFYIMISNPVADCGCFGDYMIISNGATFAKNLVIMTALVLLCCYNRRITGLYGPYVQWIPATLTILYVLVIELVGYNVQPLIDFRSFPVGSLLVENEDDEDSIEPEFEFIYEKNGEQQTFDSSNLPDSTWTFVDRRVVSGSVPGVDRTHFVVLNDDNEDVTDEVVSGTGDELLVIAPEFERIDVSYTYVLNEMYHYIQHKGGTMAALIGTDNEGLEVWRDLSMAEYPLYKAEGVMLKEMARGNMAVIYLKDGVIQWKRNMFLVDADWFDITGSSVKHLDSLSFDGHRLWNWLTLIYIGLMGLVCLLDHGGHLLNRPRVKRQDARKNEWIPHKKV